MNDASKKILSFYDEHIDEHGSGPRAVGWNDTRSQEARFAALCTVGDLEGASVLDVGCGLGDLYGYLHAHYQNFDYTGIDINPRYIEQARQIYPDANFATADFAEYKGEMFDYVVASGVFAVKIPNYKEVYFGQIKKMFAMARKGIACTMLNAERHPNDAEYAAYTTVEVRNFCLTLGGEVYIRDNYLPHDFTVIVRKNEQLGADNREL